MGYTILVATVAVGFVALIYIAILSTIGRPL
jgi:hypothetical protein